MSTLAVASAPLGGPGAATLDAERSLDELVASAWKALTDGQPVTCPVCEAGMVPAFGPRVRPLGGRCEECGSTLR